MSTTASEVPQPVTIDRLHTLLNALDEDLRLGFRRYSDTTLVIPTLSALIFVELANHGIVQVRGQWRGEAVREEDFPTLASQVQMCNIERSGPKAYLWPHDDGTTYGLGAEVNYVISQGATDAQLVEFYETALTMIVGFFRDVEVAMPHLVDWPTAVDGSAVGSSAVGGSADQSRAGEGASQ